MRIDFLGIWDLNWKWFGSSIFDRVKSSGWKSHLFSSLENPCFEIIPSQVRCYVFFLHQVEEGKGEDGAGGNGRQAPLFGSLAGAICQSSWLARHEISVIVIWRRYQGLHGGFLLQVGLTVWFLAGLVWFQPRGLDSFFPDSVYEVGIGAILDSYGGYWIEAWTHSFLIACTR